MGKMSMSEVQEHSLAEVSCVTRNKQSALCLVWEVQGCERAGKTPATLTLAGRSVEDRSCHRDMQRELFDGQSFQ